MSRRTKGLVLAVVAASIACAGAKAQAPAVTASPCAPVNGSGGAQFAASTSRRGLIDLYLFQTNGATVSYYECVGGRALPLARRSEVVNGATALLGATTWRCGRRTRNFAATATLSDGSVLRGISGVRTKSCADRFRFEAPSRIGRGQKVRVRIVDRFGIGGIHTRLCVSAPNGQRRCQAVAFADSATAVTRTVRPSERGDWKLQLQVRQYRVNDTIAVGVNPRPVKHLERVLATGDSTMQGVESFLSDDVADRATVVSDVRPGFTMSIADGWQTVATRQVAQLHPSITVMSLGAAEGFPMEGSDHKTHDCCDAGWVAEYTRRVRRTMVTYRRAGHGRVFYLTIVAPRDPARAPIVTAVNKAILLAARGLSRVRVLRMDQLFSPHGYQQVIHYGGRDVDVREPDGVHLNVAGTAIEAAEVARAIRPTLR